MDVMAKPEKTADESNGVSLKSLLENPFLLLPKEDEQIVKDGSDKDQDKQKEKEKELELAYDPFGNVDPMSAFLGPKLWDDSMLYGDKNLKFEFMDIDEFFNEHGILGSDSTSNTTTAATEKNGSDNNAQDETSGTTAAATAAATTAVPDEVAALAQALSPTEVIPMSIETNSATEATESIQRASLPTPPREPSPINVNVDFEVSHTDVALATIPGQEIYDPRQKQFSEEELKPQPMIKKSRKVFVPDEQKDDKYWERRRKNNIAAKRSRDARRVKENQIVLRAAYLQKENGVLKEEVLTLKKENLSLKSVVEKLEKQLKEAVQQ